MPERKLARLGMVLMAAGLVPWTGLSAWEGPAGPGTHLPAPAADATLGACLNLTGSIVHVCNLSADYLDGMDSTEFAPAGHDHDGRYFTEAESDARFAPVGHDHDGRYYALGAKVRDADELDGLDSSRFAQTDATGSLAVRGSVYADASSAYRTFHQNNPDPSLTLTSSHEWGGRLAFGDTPVSVQGPGKLFVAADVSYPPTAALVPWVALALRAVQDGTVVGETVSSYMEARPDGFTSGSNNAILDLPSGGTWTVQIVMHKEANTANVRIHAYSLSAFFLGR